MQSPRSGSDRRIGDHLGAKRLHGARRWAPPCFCARQPFPGHGTGKSAFAPNALTDAFSNYLNACLISAEEGSIERLVQLLSDEDERVVDGAYRTISLAVQRSEHVQDAICFSSVLPILLQKARLCFRATGVARRLLIFR